VDFVGLLKECQGERTQQEFADQLGLTQAQLSRLLAGKSHPGMRTLRALWREYPNKREEIGVLLASEYAQVLDEIPESVQEAVQ
jgi:transcriptional regulator with XRE-family HTH domain